MRILVLLLLLGTLWVPSVAQSDDSQMSLAERAAAARHKNSAEHGPSLPELTPEQRGSIRSGKYVNEFFHFEITPLPGWDALSAGQMNLEEAIGRGALHEHDKPFAGGTYRVFGMHSGTGSSAFVTILPLRGELQTSSQDELVAKMKKTSIARLPSAKELQETLSLGDAKHPFSACRLTYAVQGIQVFDSLQLLRMDNFLLTVSITAGSEKELSGLLTVLKRNLVFEQPGAAAAR